MGNLNEHCAECFGSKPVNPANSKLIKPKPFVDEKDKPPSRKPSKSKQNNQTTDKTNTTQNEDSTLLPTPSEKSKGIELQQSNKPEKVKKDNSKLSIDDFELIRVIGRGSFGKVYLVRKKDNQKYYAMKTLKKEEVLARNQIDNALTEKSVLQYATHPFVVRLRYSFQNESTLYMVMDFLQGGELFTHLKKKGRFDEATTRFYACEVILALEYLHDKLDIIYRQFSKEICLPKRDLKPENILLDATGHIKITDFGLSKATKKSFSFCGTPEYLAPEILLAQGHDKAVDWWSLGCLIYEMLAGYPPFSNKDRKKLYNEILKNNPTFPSHFPDKAKDLLSKLIVKNPKERLGYGGAIEIKNHPFFESIRWEEVLIGKLKPPITPVVTKPEDLRNFDREYTTEQVAETPTNNNQVLQDSRNKIQGFTYVQNELNSYANPQALVKK